MKNFFLIFYCSLGILGCKCENPANGNADGNVRVIWSYDIPYINSPVSPAIENGKAYIVSDTTISCVELASGKKTWSRSLEIGNNETTALKVISSSDKVYFNHNKTIFAFNKSDGNVAWRTTVNDFQGITFNPLNEVGQYLFLGGQGEILKILKQTGEIIQRIPLNKLIPAQYSQGAYRIAVSNDERYLYVPTGWWDGVVLHGNIFCYEVNTGKYIWGYEIPNRKVWLGGTDSVFTTADALGCAVDDSTVLSSAGSSIFLLNRFTGNLKWETFIEKDGFWGVTALRNGIAYAGSGALSTIYALDPKNGKIFWKTQLSAGIISTIFEFKDDHLFVCNSLMGQLWILNANTGAKVFSGFPPEYQKDRSYIYNSNVAVGEGYMIIVGSKKVYCLNAP